MLLQPCKGCTDRHPNCHSECEKYAEMRAQREEIRRKRWVTQDLLNCEIELQRNMQGRKKGKGKNVGKYSKYRGVY